MCQLVPIFVEEISSEWLHVLGRLKVSGEEQNKPQTLKKLALLCWKFVGDTAELCRQDNKARSVRTGGPRNHD